MVYAVIDLIILCGHFTLNKCIRYAFSYENIMKSMKNTLAKTREGGIINVWLAPCKILLIDLYKLWNTGAVNNPTIVDINRKLYQILEDVKQYLRPVKTCHG